MISDHWWLQKLIKFVNKQSQFLTFWALESLFVTENCFAVNQNHWNIVEEDSSSHLTYQTLISDHWWLQKLIKSQKSWLFVYQFRQFLQSPVIRYQCLLCQMKAGVFFNEFSIILINNKIFFSNKQRLYSPKHRNRDYLFTYLLHY